MNQNLDVSVKYEFPKGFQPEILKGLAGLLESSIIGFNLSSKMMVIRDSDMSTDVQQALNTVVTQINQFKFQNQATIESPLPFVTNSKEVVTKLRRELHDSVYRLVGMFRDFDVTVKLQLFNLTQFPHYTRDLNVEHLSASGQVVESAESMKAKLAMQNLQEIARFFDSVERSEAMSLLAEAVKVLETIQPTVSFGGLKFEEESTVFTRLDRVKF